ncbi:MAG: hypothetical protein ACOCP8_09120 [archaeon]
MVKIKGWEKVKDNSYHIKWNGKDGDVVNIFYKPNYQGEDTNWLVGANGILHIKKFRTKEKAKKSAYKYMRSHPNG